MSYTEILSEYATAVCFDELPAEVVSAAQMTHQVQGEDGASDDRVWGRAAGELEMEPDLQERARLMVVSGGG